MMQILMRERQFIKNLSPKIFLQQLFVCNANPKQILSVLTATLESLILFIRHLCVQPHGVLVFNLAEGTS